MNKLIISSYREEKSSSLSLKLILKKVGEKQWYHCVVQ